MATSKVAIANAALQRLGASRIEALDQDAPNARSMAAAYDIARESLLRRYDWGFAIRRDSIAADGDQTLWGGHNRFVLPNDYLRLLRDDESGQRVDWKIESEEGVGVFIVTDDAAPLQIRYVANVDDPNFYDAAFRNALALRLALDTCQEITQSSAKKAGIQSDLDDAIAEATRSGAIEKDAQEPPEDDWVNARL